MAQIPLDAAIAVQASRGQEGPPNSLVVLGPDGKPAALLAGSPGQFTHLNATTGLIEWAAGAGGASGATPAVVLGAAAAAGTSPHFLRDDDTIAAFDTTAPVNQAFGDSAAVGSAAKAARRDHKHGMPASPERAQSTTSPSAPGVASYGSGTTDARGDHVHPLTETINFIIDGGGATITTGIKGDIVLDFACTIVSAELRECSSVGTATAVVNIWKTAESGWPPTVSNTITSSTPPTLAGAAKEIDSTLTSWTTSVAAGDILRVNVDSCTGGQRLTLSLKVRRA